MKARIDSFIEKRTWLVSIIFVMVLLILVNVFGTPLLNSGDDAFFLYTLSGGYGEAPTNLLHYNYGWHPWLGWMVKELFIANPNINWYSVFLLLCQLAGCSALLYVLLKRLKIAMAFFFFIVFFLFIETRILLSLNYTSTCFVLAAGGSLLFIYQLGKSKRLFSINNVFAILFLLVAGMLRFQIMWLAVLLFLPLAITSLPVKVFLKGLLVAGILALVLFSFNKIQEGYYRRHISGWAKQEQFRQALFYAYNRPIKHEGLDRIFVDSTEQQLFFAGFLYDSTKFTVERVSTITRQLVRQRWMDDKEDREGLFWFFIEMRIYILLFGIVILTLIVQKRYSPVRKWALSFLSLALFYAYLFIFLKITLSIHLGLLLAAWISLAYQLDKEDSLIIPKKAFTIFQSIVFLFLFAWMGIRVSMQNKTNQDNHLDFVCMLTETNKHSDKLFVSMDDRVLLNFISLWDLPKKYPARNILYKDRLITHTYQPTLDRFVSTHQFINVLYIGKPLPALGKFSDTLQGSECLHAKRLANH